MRSERERKRGGQGGTYVASLYESPSRAAFHSLHLSGGVAMKSCAAEEWSAVPEESKVEATCSTSPDLRFPRSAVHLVPAALDVIHRVHDDDVILAQVSLYGAEEGCSSRFLCASVYSARIVRQDQAGSGTEAEIRHAPS